MPPDNQISDYRHDCEYGLVVKGKDLWLRGYTCSGDSMEAENCAKLTWHCCICK
jgi:hypothetical protein